MIWVEPFSMPGQLPRNGAGRAARRDARSFEFNLGALFGVGETGLRGEPDGRVDGAEQAVIAPLDDLEEKAILEGSGVDVEKLPVLHPVVQHAERAHAGKQGGGDVEAGGEIVVVVV